MSAIRAFIVSSPAAAYRASSCGSRAKLLTSRIAEKSRTAARRASTRAPSRAPRGSTSVDDVVAQAEIQERHDRQRQQRDRDVEPQQDRRTSPPASTTDVTSGKPPLMTRFSIAVRVDVHAVDGVAGVRRDVVVQAERLQVLKQPVAQVVDHPLAGVDLHLRAVAPTRPDSPAAAARRRRTSVTSSASGSPPRIACSHPANGCGTRLPDEHVVDDDLQQPRLQRAERDLERAAGRPRASCVPRYGRRNDSVQRSERGRVARLAHPPTRLAAAAAPDGGACARFGAMRGMISGTILSWLESAT